MKTPEEILESEFATQNLTGMVRDGVIKAMEEYAIQSVECAKDSIEKIKEDNPQISEAAAYEIQEAWEKVHALEDDLHNSEYQNTILSQKCSDLADDQTKWHEAFKELSKSHIEQANKLRAKDKTIDRLENELTEAVEIMSSIYHNVDKYHLSISFKNGELFDKLKDYLGV